MSTPGLLPLNEKTCMTLPLNTARTWALSGVAMVTPLLWIFVVLTTGWVWVPNPSVTTPCSTGHGSLPLLAVKFFPINCASESG